MAVELATAYISIVPETSKIAPGVRKAMGGVEKDADAQGKSWGSKLAGGVGKTMKTGAVAAGVTVAAVLSTALAKGFGRLNAIDQAEAKLRGLGYTAADISGIMDSVTAAVTGTAFGLDEAATASASALASGIKPGKELEQYLRLIGDAATQGGASFNEMASIINKTTATGKVGMENLNQLSERGIGIMSWLAEEYGVTGAELSKMVSAGEVDVKTFRKVLNDNIGGAALESGNTFSGALANMNAALGRLGAKLLGGIFPQMKDGFGGVTGLLDRMGPAAEAMGAKVGDAIGWVADKVGGFVDDFKEGEGAAGTLRTVLESVFGFIRDRAIPAVREFAGWIKENKSWLLLLASAIVGAVVAFKAFMIVKKVIAFVKAARVAMLAFNASILANPIGIIVVAIGALVGALVWLYRNNETARKIMDAAWAKIKVAITAVVGWIKNTGWPILKVALAAIGKAAMWLWTNAIKPAFGFIWGIAKSVFGWIKNTGWPLVKAALGAIGSAAATLWSKWIKPNFERMKSGVSRMVDAFRKAKDGIGRVWSGIKEGVRRPIDAVMGFLRDKFVGPLNTLLSKIPGVDFRISLGGGAKKVGQRSGIQAATGGILPGYSPGRDNMHWIGPHGTLSLSGGEAIMRPEWTRAVGAGFVHQMNALARTGGVAAVRNALGFAKGGIIDDLKKRGSDAFRIASAPMRSIMSAAEVKKRALAMLGGIGSNGFAQAAAGVARKAIDGIVAKVKSLTEGSAEGVTGGMGGRGAAGGWQGLWAIVKAAFPSAVLTSSYRPGSITASGNRSYHSMGRAIDVTPSMAIFNYMRQNFGKTLRELIYSPAGGAQIKNGRPHFYTGAVRGMHWDHVHIAAKDGGIVRPAIFDNGGTLAPGLNLVHNKLGRPEPLVRPEQFAPRGPVRMTLVDRDGVLLGTIDGRIDAHSDQAALVARLGG